MLNLKYSFYLPPLAVLSLCFSCTSGTSKATDVSAVDSLTLRLDSIGFEPYVQALIKSGRLVNYELLDSGYAGGDPFFKDSMYQAMTASDWAYCGVYWMYSNKDYSFSTYPVTGSIGAKFQSYQPELNTYNYKFSTDELAYLKGVLDSIRLIAPDLHFKEGWLICSRLRLVYYDGNKFYYSDNLHGDAAKFFMEQLFNIFSKYYNKDKSKKKKPS